MKRIKKVFLIFFLFLPACVIETEEIVDDDICNRDFECLEYPTWQTEETYLEGFSNYECEPCWYYLRHSQKGNCCACNPEVYHKWCSSDSNGFYHCSSRGYFEYVSCYSWCVRIENLPYNGTCNEGECECLR